MSLLEGGFSRVPRFLCGRPFSAGQSAHKQNNRTKRCTCINRLLPSSCLVVEIRKYLWSVVVSSGNTDHISHNVTLTGLICSERASVPRFARIHSVPVMRHTSHVTRHTSHVTRHTSHVTSHTSDARRLWKYASCFRTSAFAFSDCFSCSNARVPEFV